MQKDQEKQPSKKRKQKKREIWWNEKITHRMRNTQLGIKNQRKKRELSNRTEKEKNWKWYIEQTQWKQ